MQLNGAGIRRFWASADRRAADECWGWTGNKVKGGYGIMWMAGQHVLATHVALHLDGRPRPDAPANLALHADNFSNPSCVNPAHLRWGTHAENMRDRERLGRRVAAGGAAHPMAVADTPENRKRKFYVIALPGSQDDVARETGLSRGMVSDIRLGKRWAHIPLVLPEALKAWLSEQGQRDASAGSRVIPGFEITEDRRAA